MNDREYSELPGIRRSDLAYMGKSPLHFRWHMDHPEEPTQALLFGQAAHAYVLENDTFFETYAFMPEGVDRRTKEGKKFYAEFMDANSGKTILPWETQDILVGMSQALHANDEIRAILTGEHRTEVPYYWQDSATGEICKVKADIIVEIDGYPFVIDYKTTADCSDSAFYRSCRQYGYDLQAGMYTEGISFCTMEDHKFAFIAQEKTAPYACRVCICDDGFVEQGRKKFHDLLGKYHACKESDKWGGYEGMILYGENYD
jgi:exodeoxyribonuclease VIII